MSLLSPPFTPTSHQDKPKSFSDITLLVRAHPHGHPACQEVVQAENGSVILVKVPRLVCRQLLLFPL